MGGQAADMGKRQEEIGLIFQQLIDIPLMSFMAIASPLGHVNILFSRLMGVLAQYPTLSQRA